MPISKIQLQSTVVIVAALALVSCMPGPPPDQGVTTAGGSTSGPVVPGAPVGDQLFAAVAGNSISGAAISGDTFCSYYAPDGSLTTVFDGFAPEYGTWLVDSGAVCENTNGVYGCSQFDYLPNGQVIVTSLDGSGSFPITVSSQAGNQCGA